MSVDVQTTAHYMTQEGPGELKIEGIETMRGLVVIPYHLVIEILYIIILYTSPSKHFHCILELEFSMNVLPRNAPFAAGEACHPRARATAQKQTLCLEPMKEVQIAFLIFLRCCRRLAPLAIVRIVPCLR